MFRLVIFLALGLFLSSSAYSAECDNKYYLEEKKGNTNWADIVFDGKVKAKKYIPGENGEIESTEVRRIQE